VDIEDDTYGAEQKRKVSNEDYKAYVDSILKDTHFKYSVTNDGTLKINNKSGKGSSG
jgi:hypothetical protein